MNAFRQKLNTYLRTFLLAVLFTLVVQHAACGARLAVVPLSGDLNTAADLLTVSLSQTPGCQLVERTQINAVMREQGLAASTGRDFVKLGQLLRADGLLLLETQGRSNAFTQARLVAVQPGIILDESTYNSPIQDLPSWVKIMAQKVSGNLAKLAVPIREARAVSMLNLRAATATSESQSIERELTFLLTRRLMHEPSLFVLERTRMETLTAEHSLSGDQAAFWSGSYLLDGTVVLDALAQGRIGVRLRLKTPDGQTVSVNTAGPSRDLPRFVDGVASQLFSRIKSDRQSTPWNSLDEAKQYLEEVKWALKWKSNKEAVSAAEAAWSLGLRTTDMAELRVRAYGESARTKSGNWYQRGPIFRAQFDPEPECVNHAINALDYYMDFVNSQPKSVVLPMEWKRLGVEELFVASELLFHFYHAPSGWKQSASTLVALRSRVREVDRLLRGFPEMQSDVSHSGLLQLEGNYWGLWFETPQQALDYLQKMLEDGSYRRAPSRIVKEMFVAAWEDMDAERVDGIRRSFFSKLEASTRLDLQFEARLLALASYDSEYAWRECARKIMAMARSHGAELYPEGERSLAWRATAGLLGGPSSYAVDGVLGRTLATEVQPFLAEMRKRWLESSKPAPTIVATPRPSPVVLTNSPLSRISEVEQAQFVPFAEVLPSGRRLVRAFVQGTQLSGNDLWLQLNYPGDTDQVPPGVITVFARLNLTTLRYDWVEAPKEMGYAALSRVVRQNIFAAQDGMLLFSMNGKAMKCSVTAKSWQPLKNQPVPEARFHSINGRLYVLSPDSLIEMDPMTETTRVLASPRRRPALNELDKMTDLRAVVLTPGAGTSLRVLTESAVFETTSDTAGWRKVCQTPQDFTMNPQAGRWQVDPGPGMLLLRCNNPSRTFGLAAGGASFELLLEGPQWGPSEPLQARWKAPLTMDASSRLSCVTEDGLWVLAGPDWHERYAASAGQPGAESGVRAEAELLLCKNNSSLIRSVPVWFDNPKHGMASVPARGWSTEHQFVKPTRFFQGRGRLALVIHEMPGVWVLDEAKLKARLKPAVERSGVRRNHYAGGSSTGAVSAPKHDSNPKPAEAKAPVGEGAVNLPEFKEIEMRLSKSSEESLWAAANGGDHSARFWLAHLAVKRLSPIHDNSRLIVWMRPVARGNLVQAKIDLAGLLLAHRPQDPELRDEARKLLEAAAESGSSDGQMALGLFLHGHFPKERYGVFELENSATWFKKAFQSGRKDAAARLGYLYLQAGEMFRMVNPTLSAMGLKNAGSPRALSRSWFEIGAKDGDISAEFGLALWHLSDDSTPQEQAAGVVKMRDLAARKYAPAIRALGQMYMPDPHHGPPPASIQPDTERAKEALIEAANLNDEKACVILGLSMFEGELPGGAAVAVEWLQRALDHGSEHAPIPLAELYDRGIAKPRHPGETPAELRKQMIRFKVAYNPVVFSLSEYYRHGKSGIEKDRVMGAAYTMLADYQRDPEAIPGSAWVFSNGTAKPQSTPEEKEFAAEVGLCYKALMKGDPASCKAIAVRYRSGGKVPRDQTLAYVWYRLAQAEGDAASAVLADDVKVQLSELEVFQSRDWLSILGNFKGMRDAQTVRSKR